MNEWLEHFTTLIQLIGVASFAYVFIGLPHRLYGMLFDEKKMRKENIDSFLDELKKEDNYEDLKRSYFPDEDVEKDELRIKLLIRFYDSKEKYGWLVKEWSDSTKKIDDYIEKIVSGWGTRSLFLYAALFSVVNLLNIAVVNVLCPEKDLAQHTVSHELPLFFMFLFNVISVYFVAKLTNIVLKRKWHRNNTCICYEKVFSYFKTALLLAAIFTTLNCLALSCSCIVHPPIVLSRWVVVGLQMICIALPIYPFIFSFYYITNNIPKIEPHVERILGKVQKEQREWIFQKKRLEFDLSRISPKDFSWEGDE